MLNIMSSNMANMEKFYDSIIIINLYWTDLILKFLKNCGVLNLISTIFTKHYVKKVWSLH